MTLFRSAATISSLTLLSRVTGLVRDILVARAFGAGPLTDAFWVAFRIPNLLRRLFAEGAFSQAFVPILGAARNDHDDQAEPRDLARLVRGVRHHAPKCRCNAALTSRGTSAADIGPCASRQA